MTPARLHDAFTAYVWRGDREALAPVVDAVRRGDVIVTTTEDGLLLTRA